MDDLYDRLLDKSQELFVLAVELYNRPTIKYHAEGCAIFLCSAWELMLKAEIYRRFGNGALYYRDSHRTLSLEDCLRKIFTNEKDPLRKNMDKVIDLRNTSTHFVTTEYEIFYGPILQACVSNYADKLQALHNRTISTVMPENYLNLSVTRTDVDEELVKAKYPPEVAERLLELYNSIALDADEGSARYAAYYRTELTVVKNPKKADLAVRFVPTAQAGIAIAKELHDPRQKYIYTYKRACEAIDKKLRSEGIEFTLDGVHPARFNLYHFRLFISCYQMKSDERYSFDRATKGEQANYTYSQQAVDFVIDSLRRDPGILTALKASSKPQTRQEK